MIVVAAGVGVVVEILEILQSLGEVVVDVVQCQAPSDWTMRVTFLLPFLLLLQEWRSRP